MVDIGMRELRLVFAIIAEPNMHSLSWNMLDKPGDSQGRPLLGLFVRRGEPCCIGRSSIHDEQIHAQQALGSDFLYYVWD